MLKGKVHKYGANVDTDAIIPARLDRVQMTKVRGCLVGELKGAKLL